ncbi:MAG: hypothetical protein D3925_01025 [Candidatus Electrothrix sp. AR5]|nr:hypothetical protein [Candidatus Electrothrix sp. AR5]
MPDKFLEMYAVIKSAKKTIQNIVSLVSCMLFRNKNNRDRHKIISEINTNNCKCIVTGNGPSYNLIKNSVNRFLSEGNYLICCNAFLFYEQRLLESYPNKIIYILSDPVSFKIIKFIDNGGNFSDLTASVININERKFQTFIDFYYAGFASIEILLKNKQVKFICPGSWLPDLPSSLSSRTITFNDDEMIFPKFINRYLGCLHHQSLQYPRNYTSSTIIKGLAAAINFGFHEVYISGIDTDYLRYAYSNEKNKTIIINKYFFNEEGIADDSMPLSMLELINAISRFMSCLEDCYPIDIFSDRIFNTQHHSILDFFTKRSI